MDKENPTADAIAIRGGRFVAVGSFDSVLSAVGPDHIVSEKFSRNTLIAGLIDQHLHPLLGATTLTTEVIAPEDWILPRRIYHAAKTSGDFDRRLLEAHNRLAEGEWLFSWGWHGLWHGPLDRSRLDELVGNRPTAVWQRSCHEWILNTAALEAMNLTQEMTLGHGLASEQIDWVKGHFYENGWMNVLSKYLMPVFFTRERFKTGLAQLIEYLQMNGVTAINEPGISWRTEPWDLYQEILGHPDVPFESTFLVNGRIQSVRHLLSDQFVDDARDQVSQGEGKKVRVLDGHVKLFADGAIISQLMQMNDPYLDHAGEPDPHHHGEWMMKPDDLKYVFDAYWDADWQVHIHVNGDNGLDVVLNTLEQAQSRKPRVDHRTVIVHFACSNERQVDRIANLGAIVSANPYYPVGFADKYGTWGLGPRRADEMVRSASVLRRQIPLSFHSDLPMCPSDPLQMVSFAVNRVTQSGRVACPEQRIGVHDALRAVTIEAAYSWRREHEIGSIEVGKKANVTVLDSDPYEVDVVDLGKIQVLATMFEGRVFDVESGLVAQRRSVFNTSGDHRSTIATVCASNIGCSCEVASFIADYMAMTSWAA